MSSSRPAKRARKSTIVVSDDDEEHAPHRTASSTTLVKAQISNNVTSRERVQSTTKLSTRKSTIARSANKSPNATLRNSPQKIKKNSGLCAVTSPQHGPINSFFSRVADQERWKRRSKTPEINSQNTVLEDDIDDRDDVSTDDAISVTSKASDKLGQRKKNAFSASNSFASRDSGVSLASSSQRFRKRQAPEDHDPVPSLTMETEQYDRRTWSDRYKPDTLDELAIHKNKSQEVQKWLFDAASGKSQQRLLVLTGTAGTGKSTAVELVAKHFGYTLVSWQNPDANELGGLSTSLQFGEFVMRGGDYGVLSLPGSDSIVGSSRSEARFLVIEDFPVALTRNTTALETFRQTMQIALSTTGNKSRSGEGAMPLARPPIIMIVTETLVSATTASADSFTAHRLLGPQILTHPYVNLIEFNPVAPTFIKQALDLVVRKEARNSGRRRIPGQTIMQRLSEIGDLRNAINTLELLCTRNDESWSGTVATVHRANKGIQKVSEAESSALDLVSARESTMDMFHAVGKIVYNKRHDPAAKDSGTSPVLRPPDHLAHLCKPLVSQVNLDDLLAETGADIQTFISAVHENYVLSCNHDDFVDHFNLCSSYLSDAEVLDPDGRNLLRARGNRRTLAQSNTALGASDTVRQDEISFNVASRGVLLGLPYPVKRASINGARKQDAFKMVYPTGLRIWKSMEEINGLIEYIAGSFGGDRQPVADFEISQDDVASWQARASLTTFQRLAENGDCNIAAPRKIVLSKDILVQDYLPYLQIVNSARHENTEVLNKITQIRGTLSTDKISAEEDAMHEQSLTSKQPVSIQKTYITNSVRGFKDANQKEVQGRQNLLVDDELKQNAIEKLYIEEDDIEDSD